MRKHVEGELLRPSLTRFALKYKALKNLFVNKLGLRAMITFDAWRASKYVETN